MVSVGVLRGLAALFIRPGRAGSRRASGIGVVQPLLAIQIALIFGVEQRAVSVDAGAFPQDRGRVELACHDLGRGDQLGCRAAHPVQVDLYRGEGR